MFLAKHFSITWLPWQQWMIYHEILKDDLYIGLIKSKSFAKIGWIVFEILSNNPHGGIPPPPRPNRVKMCGIAMASNGNINRGI